MAQIAPPLDTALHGATTLDGSPTLEVLEGFARLHGWMFVTDGDGSLVWMSPSLEEECGSFEHFRDQTWRTLFCGLPPGMSKTGPTCLLRNLRAAGAFDGVVAKLRGSVGNELEVAVSAFALSMLPGSAPRLAPSNQLVVTILRPMDERRRAETLMREQRDFFRGVLDASPDAVVALDQSSFVAYANAAAESLLEEAPGSMRGKPVALFVPKALAFEELAAHNEPHTEVTDVGVEFHRRRGAPVQLSLSSRNLRDTDGNVSGSVVFLRDVTAEYRIREQLERKNGELESYVHSVSHDLRTPLVSLLGFTRLMRQDYGALFDDAGRHFLDRIEQSGRTMEALIQDLLELSRIGSEAAHRSWIDPFAVLIQLRAEIKPQLDEQGIELLLPENSPLLLCDRTRVYQLFSNLIGNAISHMGPCKSPRIEIEIKDLASEHLVIVRDNGRGIPEAEHLRIFEVFQMLGPRRDDSRSSGIGLAIVHKIAEAHGGRAWVESEPGSGAAFHITLSQ